MIRWIRFQWRWWRWFLGGPLCYELIVSGVDRDSRKIIYDRWRKQEPEPEGE